MISFQLQLLHPSKALQKMITTTTSCCWTTTLRERIYWSPLDRSWGWGGEKRTFKGRFYVCKIDIPTRLSTLSPRRFWEFQGSPRVYTRPGCIWLLLPLNSTPWSGTTKTWRCSCLDRVSRHIISSRMWPLNSSSIIRQSEFHMNSSWGGRPNQLKFLMATMTASKSLGNSISATWLRFLKWVMEIAQTSLSRPSKPIECHGTCCPTNNKTGCIHMSS